MAGAAPVESKGGKRSLDVEFNLVPFIDLLSVLISFLLVVAVWTEIAAMDVKHAPTQGGEPPRDKKVSLTITLTERASYLELTGMPPVTVEKNSGEYDWAKMSEQLKDIRRAIPDLDAATILAEDQVDYGYMIQAMDVCRDNGLPGISLGGVPKTT